eukprot:TRINITY_DN26743_c0_g1_i2.p1 TRINITY_DN26743_c0_g1~~TRINITY_DN26743_c0_g1_i2.p1  ORF type:complete len:354 (+),score=55.30 TRINITY_DN26743_c0_g1_i2:963-2024(+)
MGGASFCDFGSLWCLSTRGYILIEGLVDQTLAGLAMTGADSDVLPQASSQPYSNPVQWAAQPPVSIPDASAAPPLLTQAAPGARSPSPVAFLMDRQSPWTAFARIRSLSGERAKQERDSLRSRSHEGRPGSRKNNRWVQSRALVHTLRSAMAACGEDGTAADVESIVAAEAKEFRPSAFYRLLQREGPECALDAWSAAEASVAQPTQEPRRARSRPRLRTTTHGAAEGDGSAGSQPAEHTVRRAFDGLWTYVRSSDAVQKLLSDLEDRAAQAFSSSTPRGDVEPWRLCWDGEARVLSPVSGDSLTLEIEVIGLAGMERKVVHRFARALGLVSESFEEDGLPAEPGDDGEHGEK